MLIFCNCKYTHVSTQLNKMKSPQVTCLVTVSVILMYIITWTCSVALAAPTSTSSSKEETIDPQVYLCLHNCALCVRQWEPGVYNGEKCARKCIKFQENPRVIDPDCSSPRLFNYKVMKKRGSPDVEQ